MKLSNCEQLTMNFDEMMNIIDDFKSKTTVEKKEIEETEISKTMVVEKSELPEMTTEEEFEILKMISEEENEDNDEDNSKNPETDVFVNEVTEQNTYVSSTLQMYLHNLPNVKYLTQEEEIALGHTRDQALKNNNKELYNETINTFVTHNLKYVVSIANKFKDFENISDIIQEGNLGLIVAAKKYDPESGYRFTTYATFWIYQKIYALCSHKQIRVPLNVSSLYYRIKKLERNMESKGKEVNDEFIANQLKTTPKKVAEARKYMTENKNISSLQAKAPDMDNTTIGDIIADKHTDTEQNAMSNIVREKLIAFMKKHLTKREFDILVLRYGLNNKRPMKLEPIAKIYGVSRERVRQIEKSAILELRNHLGNEFEDVLTY